MERKVKYLLIVVAILQFLLAFACLNVLKQNDLDINFICFQLDKYKGNYDNMPEYFQKYGDTFYVRQKENDIVISSSMADEVVYNIGKNQITYNAYSNHYSAYMGGFATTIILLSFLISLLLYQKYPIEVSVLFTILNVIFMIFILMMVKLLYTNVIEQFILFDTLMLTILYTNIPYQLLKNIQEERANNI